MSWIFKELRNFAKRPLEEEQGIMDWLVFGNRAHKPKKVIPEVIKTEPDIDDIKDIIKNEELSPAPKPFIPPAPPLPPIKELIPKPRPESVIYQKPEPKENENDKFLESIRKGTTLKPVKKPEIKIKKSFLDELKEAPKLTKKEIKIIQKEVKKSPPSFNDLIKANKKFQALSRNVETKNEENEIDEFAGWGIKKPKNKRKKQPKYYYY
jgi:hypothetical protein